MSAPTAIKHDTQLISVKTLAKQWDCSRTSVCRLLEEAGVEPVFLGRGTNGTKRYLKRDVDGFLRSLERLT